MKIVFEPKVPEDVVVLPRAGKYVTSKVGAQITYRCQENGYVSLDIDKQGFHKIDILDLIDFLQALPFD